MKIFIGVIFLVNSFFAVAETLTVDQNNATLNFSGEHVGMEFTGVFEQWQATLVLPPAESPEISASFLLASAKTGDSTYDGTLPEEDWFHVKKYPQATFKATKIVESANGFNVDGSLQLKGKELPVSFMLNQSDQGLSASFEVDRLAYGIGVDSDPSADWVSKMIGISLTIKN